LNDICVNLCNPRLNDQSGRCAKVFFFNRLAAGETLKSVAILSEAKDIVYLWLCLVTCNPMKYFSHLNTAVQLLQQYDGRQPFGNFIKQFFGQHKKYGSKDRKNISQLCYAYFRLGKALQQLPVEERIITGLFLCSQQPNEVLQQLKPELNEQAHLPLHEKIQFLETMGTPPDSYRDILHDLFPWKEELSEGMDHDQFCTSFFTQPDLFLRLRPKYEHTVKSKLLQAGISFKEITPACLALPNATKTDTVIETDKEAVIQDYSSQRVGEFIHFIRTSTPAFAKASAGPSTALRVWDACAASGGKSILAFDILNNIDLTVSDVRKSILINLEKRFATAGIRHYNSFIADLTDNAQLNLHHSSFDMIITDVPCSGSGTWSRTPEQLYFFDPKEIDRYSKLQKKIVDNVVTHLKPGSFLLYCTCSVFKKENEQMVQYIKDQHLLHLQKMELLTGYHMKADTLFAALFQKK
jgi:16S rRNA (cytosine967-C5)-methyltransferase